MPKIIDFFDGAQTVTVPTIGNIEASALSTYSSDAAFETANGPGESGDVYINTTDNVIRYWNDDASEWQSILSAGTTNASDIADGSVSNTEFQYINSLTSNAQTQLNQNASDIADVASDLNTHLTQITDAHDAENISTIPLGNLSATNVQSALDELQTDVDSRIPSSEKGAPNGVAPLNASTKIDATYLPSYVDDVEEYANLAAFPITGETGKIYVAIDTGYIYRWSGSMYVQIASGASGANQTLSNLTSPVAVNQNLTPDGNNTRNIGSSSFQWADVIARKLTSYDSGGIARGILDAGITSSSASSTAITGALQLPHAPGAAFAVQTQVNTANDAVATNPLYFETGSKTNPSSTGNTGLIQFRTGSSEGGNSGSLEFYTGNVNAGTSGSMIFSTGTVSGGTRGAMTFNASGLTVNTSTINITGEFSNHLKSQFGSLTVGTTSAPFGTFYGTTSVELLSGSTTRIMLDNSSQTIPSSTSVNTSLHRPYQDSANRDLAIYTDSNATNSAVATGTLYIESGNKTAGTGNSGDIKVRIGTSSGGTRGKVYLQDGSEGTSGDVWTSTGTNGEGAWVTPSGVSQISDDTVVLDWSTSADTETADTNTGLRLRKVGDTVTMTVIGEGGFTKDGTNNVYMSGVIPSAYRPLNYTTFNIHAAIGGTKRWIFLIVYPDGSLDFWLDEAETSFTNGSVVTFPYGTSVSWIYNV